MLPGMSAFMSLVEVNIESIQAHSLTLSLKVWTHKNFLTFST